MNSNIFLTLIAVWIFLSGYAPIQAQFKWTAGGANTEEAYSVIKTPDGGYAVAGKTLTYGMPGVNIYILKFSSGGAIQWSKSIGGANEDIAFSIITTSDGGYAVAGKTSSYGAGGSDVYVIKLDANGNVQWNKVIGGPDDDVASSIIQTSDGGYAVAGSTRSFNAGSDDYYLIKLTSSGSVVWSRRTGGTGSDTGSEVIQISDGYIMVGGSMSYGVGGSYDMYIVKFNTSGVPLWSKAIGGSGPEFGGSVVQTSDGGFVISGSTMTFGAGNYDMYVVKLSSAGSLLWTRTMGSSSYEFGSRVVKTSDGGFVITGGTMGFGAAGDDIYLVKLNSAGSPVWQRRAGGNGTDIGTDVAISSDGYAVAGYTNSSGAGGYDAFVYKFDLNGNICGNFSAPSITSGSGGNIYSVLPPSYSTAPEVISPAAIIVSGGSASAQCLTDVESTSNETPQEFALGQNYPNPFNPKTIIKLQIAYKRMVTLKVYDISGKEAAVLINREMNPSTYKVDFDGANYTSGVFFYTIQAGDFTETKKMLLVK